MKIKNFLAYEFFNVDKSQLHKRRIYILQEILYLYKLSNMQFIERLQLQPKPRKLRTFSGTSAQKQFE